MKRTDFFTRLVLGFVAIWKAPEILARKPKIKAITQKDIDKCWPKSNPMLKKIEYSNKWFEENYPWLRKWVENYRVQSWKKRGKQLSTDDYFDGMQRFSEFPYRIIGKSKHPKVWTQEAIDKETKFRQEQLYEQHVKTIIRAAVFSRKHTISVNSGYGEERIGSMSGFVEQMGRLPIKTDKVRFVTCSDDSKGSRFLRVQYGRDGGSDTVTFLSDCRLEIVGKHGNN